MAVERKYERDIDILLAEEFTVSPDFTQWFLSQTRFANHQDAKLDDVFVSQSDNSGESDLVVLFSQPDGNRFAIHIEDKIDAQFMPQQRERYDIRAASGISRGDYHEYEVVLCAPKRYRETSKSAEAFSTYISYEDIAQAFTLLDDSPRGRYRAQFLTTAATRNANNWKRTDDEATNVFWNAAYKIASKEFPILEMKQRILTAGSAWIDLRPHDLPRQPKSIYLALKGPNGRTDLTFTHTTAYVFAEKVSKILEPDMTIHQAGVATVIRVGVEPYNVEDGVESGMPKVRRAFQAAERLLRFYRQHKAQLDKAAADATPLTGKA